MTLPFPAFIYVPFISSAFPSLCIRNINDSHSLLQRVADWFTDNYPNSILRILCNAADPCIAGFPTTQLRCQLIRTGETSHLAALVDAADYLNASTIIVFPLGCAYAPVSLLQEACAHHVRTQNRFTLAADWPQDAAPEVYDTNFLHEIQPYALPEFGSSISKIALTYVRALNSSAEGCGTITHVPFLPRQLYGAGDGDLPEAVDCTSVDGIHLAYKIPPSSAFDDNPLCRLKAWRDTVIKERLEDVASFVGLKPHLSAEHIQKSLPTILFVSSVSGFSGGEEALIRTVAEIDRQRYSVCALIGAEGFFAKRLREAGATVFCAEREFHTPSVLNTMYLMQIFLNLHVSLIHSNCRAGMPLTLAASLLNLPFVQHVRVFENHGWGDSVLHASAVVCVSERVKRLMLRLNLKEDRLRVIYDGIDTSAFVPTFMSSEAARTRLRLPADKRIVLMVARFEAFKQHTLLLDTFRYVHEVMPDTLLVLVGESTIGTESVYKGFMAQLTHLGLEEATVCLGFQSDIRPVMCAADIVVSTSRDEPFGLTILEALALGKPAVATNSCGAAEVLRRVNLEDVLARENSPKVLAQQILNIFENYTSVCQTIVSAHSRLVEEASTPKRSLELMSLYDELLVDQTGHAEKLSHNKDLPESKGFNTKSLARELL